MKESLGMEFRNKVLRREFLRGTHVNTASGFVTEVLARAGFDYLWIDTEHAAFDYDALTNQLNAAGTAGCSAVVRVSMLDANHTKRILEMGPEGIVFPMINTPEEAEKAMDMCFYPPRGTRGFGPLRAAGYGRRKMEEYLENYHRETARFIQIETKTAVRNLPRILRETRIDGFIFGPCDLSASIGKIGKIRDPENTALVREAAEILKEAGKSVGLSIGAVSEEELSFWHGLGINMISAGGDFVFLGSGADSLLRTFDKISEKR